MSDISGHHQNSVFLFHKCNPRIDDINPGVVTPTEWYLTSFCDASLSVSGERARESLWCPLRRGLSRSRFSIPPNLRTPLYLCQGALCRWSGGSGYLNPSLSKHRLTRELSSPSWGPGTGWRPGVLSNPPARNMTHFFTFPQNHRSWL